MIPYKTPKDKAFISGTYFRRYADITRNMFDWRNLPETIPRRELEKILQKYGYAIIIKHKGELWATYAGLGGELDPYYRPKKAIVANPWLGVEKTFTIGEDCAIIKNDSCIMGVYPVIQKAASFLTECDITQYVTLINSRAPSIVSASDENAIDSAKEYFKKLENGDLGIVAEGGFLDDVMGIKSQPYFQGTDRIIPLIELKQYTIGTLCMDLGIKAPFNMKREALGDSENGLQDMGLQPFVDDMFENRKEGAEMVSDVFGVTITPELSGVWKKTEDGSLYDQEKPEQDGQETPEQEDQEVEKNETE